MALERQSPRKGALSFQAGLAVSRLVRIAVIE
jgi:hypothetical protein